MTRTQDSSGVPLGPIDLEEAIRRFPTVRQSLLASYDDCELGALFRLRYENGWSTHPQARGTIFHRVAAECLRVMREQDSEGVPVGVALSILEETLLQRNVAPENIVRVPLREIPMLEMTVRKFASDNTFNVRNIIDVERRLSCAIRYPDENGEMVERVLTGALDALIARPPDEAIVLDWKDTWALPPERDEDADDPGVSYHGFFQQQFYAWLVMMTYPAINAVTLREFYVRRTKARPARVTRQDLPRVEQRLRQLVANFDRAVMAGQPPRLYMSDLNAHGSWKPSPGKHCFAGETRFLTDRGARSLRECVAQSVRVLGRTGQWEDAEVRSFGTQPLLRVTFDDGHVVRVTPDHRWWQEDGSRVTTVELQRAPRTTPDWEMRMSREAIRHGLTFGDGWLRTDRGHCVYRAMPHEAELADYFSSDLRQVRSGGQVFVSPLPGHWKQLPEEPSPAYARGFIAGLLAADGSVAKDGGVSIGCEGLAKAQAIAEVARVGGCVVESVRVTATSIPVLALAAATRAGRTSREFCVITIKPRTAPLIKEAHASRRRPRTQMRRMYARVVSVEPDRDEEVFCAVVPGSRSFTLANGVLTSNCDWCMKAHLCPIDDDYKGSVTSPDQASVVAAIRVKAMAVAKQCKGRLDPWVDNHGPVDVKWSKGRLVYGPRTLKGGKVRIEQFTPTSADRPTTAETDPALLDAMRAATERARAERDGSMTEQEGER